MTGSLEQTSRLGTSFTYAQDLKTKRSFSATLTANGRKLHKHKMTLFNLAITAVVAMVGFGNVSDMNADASTVIGGIGGAASSANIVDSIALAEISASLAYSADMLVADDIAENITETSVALALPTVSESYLDKQAVIKTDTATKNDITSYTAKEGDTLNDIAKQFNITTDTIRWANDLNAHAHSVRVGTKLVIPPVSGVVYTVRSGDTPEKLAEIYKSNAAQIVAFNDAEIDGLKPGQKVIIPDGKQPAPVYTPARSYASRSRGTGFSFGSAPIYGGNGYTYGYCTYYVASRVSIPRNWGNATDWARRAAATPGYTVSSKPRAGAIAQNSWMARGYGHVAIVESVSADGKTIWISDMNGNGVRGMIRNNVAVSTSDYTSYIYRSN